MGEKVIVGLVGFVIANIIGSWLATISYRTKFPNSNKYVIFSCYFVGFCGFFYAISKL